MKKYHKLFIALFSALLTTACADQFDEEIGQMSFPERQKLGVWESLGNDSTGFDVVFYLYEDKNGDTLSTTVYISPERNALDFSRVGGDITYSQKAGVTDVLFASSPWTTYFKQIYTDVATTMQRISLAERFDGRYGMQTAIHLVIPGYETPPLALLYTNICTYKPYGTPYGKWEDTNGNYNTFYAAFHPDGKVEVITPWGDDSGTFTFDENSGYGQMHLQYESNPVDFCYNEKKQLYLHYDGEDYTLLPIEF